MAYEVLNKHFLLYSKFIITIKLLKFAVLYGSQATVSKKTNSNLQVFF